MPNRRTLACALAGLLGLLGATAVAPPAAAAPSVVRVTGSQGNWTLTVDGAPYVVKGVTYGPPTSAAGSYLPDLRSVGVNTVRTWGTDASTQPLLTAADSNGIRVINGFWLGQGNDYLNDTTYKNDTLGTILSWVDAYKDDPGTLMWDVGNEVLLNLQNYYSGSQLEAERNAYASYVDQVAQAIHAADPNHPVTSTDAWVGAWPYLKADAPHLDLYAVNSYGAVCGVRQAWIDGGYTRPYLVTESGPAGEWEVPNDANGVPTEPTDTAKRDGYTTAWGCVTGHHGVALGATLFNYGIENDFGGVWYNLLTGGERRLSYYAVAAAYGGAAPANTPPVISAMSVDSAGSVPAGGTFTVHATATDPDNDTIGYHLRFSGKYVDGGTGLTDAAATPTGAGTFAVTAPKTPGVWKVYVYAEDGHGNVGIETRSFRVVVPPVTGTDLALGRPTTASSYQQTGDGAPYPPGNATDGNAGTRWASDWSDPQWLQVDLGQHTAIGHVQLYWEAAYAATYQIQVSDDAAGWTTIHTTTGGTGGVDDVDVTGAGRYVRVYGTARGTGYGYSLYEFGVYAAPSGGSGGAPLDRTGWTATASANPADAGKAVDADPASRWTSGTPMASGMSVTVDLAASHRVDRLVMDSGGFTTDYARGYAVYASTDGASWGSPLATGTGTGPQISVPFAATTARYLRIVQTGSASSWWSLVDVTAYAA
jgi:hypothetical protein